jgi:hypothetical protein
MKLEEVPMSEKEIGFVLRFFSSFTTLKKFFKLVK